MEQSCAAGAHNGTLYCTVMYCTILYHIVPYCTVLYCTVRSSLLLTTAGTHHGALVYGVQAHHGHVELDACRLACSTSR